ncbi:MAG: hypothetical protein IPG34_00375 [Rhodocyclaceae bacterium]|nr:hypothetical protein [Rhodocyclaceae bacterium]
MEEVLFFGGQPLNLGERFVRTERFDSIDTYSEFVFKCLWPFIGTKFVMIVHWDGFITEPSLWRSEFLAHDYIGAPWAWAVNGANIGNGGFCIRSRKLMLACRDVRLRRHPEIAFGGAEDIVIGRLYRTHLEAQGLSFASTELAAAFSSETGERRGPSFGFHGPDNMPLFLVKTRCSKSPRRWRKKSRRPCAREVSRALRGARVSAIAGCVWSRGG